ncbi:MAG: hypothetical protein KBC84_11150, partial [Proteobacteria bacterium]|nr:hypothetical protein [Pseudomonadota bacterium]
RSVVSLQSARLYSAAEKELQLAKVAGNSELPTKVAELPKRIQNLSKYSEYAAESVDIAEGLPDFFKNSENFGNRALHLLANPFELKRYRELSGAALQLTASALDLVDRRQSGETSRLRNQPTTVSSVFSQELNQEIENLGGATVTEHGRVLYLKDQQAVATLYQRRAEELQLKLEENPFSFKGIKSMLIGTATASSITEASNTIQAFYDKEYGVTVTSTPTTEIAKRRHDAYIAHEAVHKTIDEIGLTAFIQREERYCRIVENNMHIDIDTLLEKKDGPLQLEELFAHIAEYEVLNTYGLDNFKDAGVEIAFLEHENPFITNYEKISDFVFENYPHQGMDLEYSTTLLAGQDGRKNRRKREKAERFARRTQAIDRAHEITTGKVPLSGQPFDFGSAILTFSQQTYQAQLAVERLLYEAIGMSREVIDGLIKKHEPRKREWIRELMAYQQPIAVGWGGAADQIITKDKNAEKIITSIQEVANRLVLPERKFGLMHGSSTTGFMGAYDRAWLQAATAIYGDKYLEHIGIFTIPLCWTTDEVREIAAESGLAAHVCPPHLFLPLRTLDFALRKPIFYMCSPGGMGTNFEIAFIMLEWQLRKMLVTVASSWNTPTPIYLMDYKMGKESLNAQAEELAKQYNVSVAEVKKSFHLSNRWFYDGLREHFNRQVLARACKPSNIENVYILRVGKGEDIEFGIKVYYFDTEQELADYVAAEADKDLAADPEGLRGRRIHLP